jgi:hypothetical protein
MSNPETKKNCTYVQLLSLKSDASSGGTARW